MIDPAPLPPTPAAVAAHDAHGVPAALALQQVEERLRRLEDAVAALQDRPARAAARPDAGLVLSHADPAAPAGSGTSDLLRETSRRLLPLAVGFLHGPSSDPTGNATATGRRPWLLVEAVDELRLIFRMFTDRRYRVSWVAWVVPLAVVFLMVTSSMLIGGIPFVGSSLAKVVDLILAFFAYKALTREAHRYREAAPYLPDPQAY